MMDMDDVIDFSGQLVIAVALLVVSVFGAFTIIILGTFIWAVVTGAPVPDAMCCGTGCDSYVPPPYVPLPSLGIR